MAHGGTATHLLRGNLNVPEGNRGDWQQAARIGRGPFTLPVVVNLHTGQHQLWIVEFQKLLGAETADIRIHYHRPDTHLVHVLEPRFRIVRAWMHLFVAAGRIFEAAAACGSSHPGIGQHPALAAQYPSLSALATGLDSWDTVAQMSRCAAG